MELLVWEFHGSKLDFFVISPVHSLWSSSSHHHLFWCVTPFLFSTHHLFCFLFSFRSILDLSFNKLNIKSRRNKQDASFSFALAARLALKMSPSPFVAACCLRSPVVCVPTSQQIGHICCYSRQAHGGQVPCSDKPDTSLKGCRKHQRLQLSSWLLY